MEEVRQLRTYRAIAEYHKEVGFPIEAACKLLHVARSAYHKWASGKRCRRAMENERLAEKIEKIHSESPDKGYRRLNDDLRHDYGIDVLVPDRFAFAENFPDIPCDRMTIDDYMALTLKGGVR